MDNDSPRRPRGRPVEFDRTQALDMAVGVFWEKGYDSASLDDLVGAMAISRPSLYAAFENKHSLFLDALDRYAETFGAEQIKPFIEESDPSNAVLGYLTGIARMTTPPSGPCGCLIANVATEAAERDEIVRGKLINMTARLEELIADQLAILPSNILRQANATERAKMIIIAGQGIATQARVGANRRDLEIVAKKFAHALTLS